MPIIIKKVTSEENKQKCMEIRITVFVKGQNVPLHEEADGKDHECDHYLLRLDDKPAATARVRYEDDLAKIERVAVLEQYRKRGYGKMLMEHIIAEIQQTKPTMGIKLGAQIQAIAFYEKLGFEICSPVYIDAGIEHKYMLLTK